MASTTAVATACSGTVDSPSDSPPSEDVIDAMGAWEGWGTSQEEAKAAVNALKEDYPQLESEIDGTVSVALAPVGTGAILALGSADPMPAWSTVKVPIAQAAIRANVPNAGPLIEAAITASDNDAARALWEQIGGDAAGPEAVREVVRSAGDRHTEMLQSQLFGPHVSFGVSDWTIADSATFISAFACEPDAGPLLSTMTRIIPEHRWGLGGLPGAAFKGGWGPDDFGAYTVRQLGLVPTEHGVAAIALGVQPSSGLYDDGVEMANRITEWLRIHVANLPGGQCADGHDVPLPAPSAEPAPAPVIEPPVGTPPGPEGASTEEPPTEEPTAP